MSRPRVQKPEPVEESLQEQLANVEALADSLNMVKRDESMLTQLADVTVAAAKSVRAL